MPLSSPLAPPAAAEAELETVIADVERGLAALAQALLARDSRGIDTAAVSLQRALANALDRCQQHARRGPLPPALRQRLVQVSGQVAAQRETLARATAALDRAVDLLIPRDASGYTARGSADWAAHSGASLTA